MAKSYTGRKRVRKSFGRIPSVAPMPNLIEVQKSSYDHFLQMDTLPEARASVGLQEVFRSGFPIKDFSERGTLEFVKYELEQPKYDVEECQQRGMTFAAPLKVTLRLVVWDVDEDTGARSIRDIKEQDVYMGDIPLMTANGTFVINGTERVIVSQMHRSPGVCFDHDKGKTHSSGKYLYQARIIPYRGSWLDFEFDPKDLIYCRIDRRRKKHATALLKALGYTTHERLGIFYENETIYIEQNKKYSKSIEYDLLPGQRATRDIKVEAEVVVRKNRKFTRAAIRKLREAGLDRLPVDETELGGKISAEDVGDEEARGVML